MSGLPELRKIPVHGGKRQLSWTAALTVRDDVHRNPGLRDEAFGLAQLQGVEVWERTCVGCSPRSDQGVYGSRSAASGKELSSSIRSQLGFRPLPWNFWPSLKILPCALPP